MFNIMVNNITATSSLELQSDWTELKVVGGKCQQTTGDYCFWKAQVKPANIFIKLNSG